MHRSIIIVKHGPHSHKITELVDNTHLFDNQIMDAFLEQFTYTENTAKQGGQEPDRKELMRQARIRKLDIAVYEKSPSMEEKEDAIHTPIQEQPYTYNDIISIYTKNFMGYAIAELPVTLEKLELRSTRLTALPSLPPSIQSVTISGSYIRALPEDLSHLTHMIQFKLHDTHLDLDTVTTASASHRDQTTHVGPEARCPKTRHQVH